MKIAAQILTASIRGYQVLISPWLGPHCRFYPSCSEVTRQAIFKYGLNKGLWIGLRHLLRCHPYE